MKTTGTLINSEDQYECRERPSPRRARRAPASPSTAPKPASSIPKSKSAPDTIIEPYVQLLGKTRVGSGCRIRSFSVIENCTLGDKVLIRQSCVLEDSTIADGAELGPFVHLRPGCEIGENAHIGNFVEGKKVRMGKGAKANHLSYLGDAEIGEGSNIGAGTITCNYDGVDKHRTQIGKRVFVGSDTTLVAPITLGDGSYIGAGSCITKDVPADALAVAAAARSPRKAGPPLAAPDATRKNHEAPSASRAMGAPHLDSEMWKPQQPISHPHTLIQRWVLASVSLLRLSRQPCRPTLRISSRKKLPTASGFFPATPPKVTATTSSSR